MTLREVKLPANVFMQKAVLMTKSPVLTFSGCTGGVEGHRPPHASCVLQPVNMDTILAYLGKTLSRPHLLNVTL